MGIVGGEHSRFAEFIRPSRIGHHVSGLFRGHRESSLGHKPLGAVAVVLLLAPTAATVWTGAFGGEFAEELHEVVAWSLLAMVGLHVIAVVVMSLLEKENLVRAMVTGRKPAHRHPGAADARRPGAIAIIVASLVVIGTVFLVLQYDPAAFTRRSAETFEERGNATASAQQENLGEED